MRALLSLGKTFASLPFVAAKSIAPGIWLSLKESVPFASSKTTDFDVMAVFQIADRDIGVMAGVNRAGEEGESAESK